MDLEQSDHLPEDVFSEYTHQGVRVRISRRKGRYWVSLGTVIHPLRFATKTQAMQWALDELTRKTGKL